MNEQSSLTEDIRRNAGVVRGLADKHLVDLQTMFLQSASHELRTPLNSVLGYSELLCEGCLGEIVPEQSDAITKIRDSARALHKVVERLTLLMSVQTEGLERVELDMTEVVEDVVGNKVQDAMAKGVNLEMMIEPELPAILGDGPAVLEAVQGLVENAVRFTPAGGEIGVQLYQDSGWLWLAVQDNGPGIPVEAQPYVFDRFYQADGRLVRDYEGLGLGLAVAREVFEAIGAKIRLHSTPGHGCCFTVKIPAVARRAELQLPLPNEQKLAQQVKCCRKKDRIWLMDSIPHQPC